MDWFFFRVEHDLLKSEAFRSLGGSAIKVYLVIGLHADFGTDWAFPSIRTIAKQAGLSRQTVLDAIEELTNAGLLAVSKSPGKATAYRILRNAPKRPKRARSTKETPSRPSGPISLEEGLSSGLEFFEPESPSAPESLERPASRLGLGGRGDRPKQEPATREEEHSTAATISIPGTPFRLTAQGEVVVAADLQKVLTEEGLPKKLVERITAQEPAEGVVRVLLNAFHLRSQGKLQNAPGYIRAGIEDGYDLLPQVASKLEQRRRQLEEHLRSREAKSERERLEHQRDEEEEAIRLLIERLHPDELARLLEQAVAELPEPLVRRNPTLSNPFVRGKIYELAGGEPFS